MALLSFTMICTLLPQRLLLSEATLLPALAALSDYQRVDSEVAKESLWVIATLANTLFMPSTLAAATVGGAASAGAGGLDPGARVAITDQLVAHVVEAIVSDKFELQRSALLASEQISFIGSAQSSLSLPPSPSSAPSSSSSSSFGHSSSGTESSPVVNCRRASRSRLVLALVCRSDAIKCIVELLRVADVDVNLACVRVLRELAETDMYSNCSCNDCRRSGLPGRPASYKVVFLLRDLGLHGLLDDIQYGPGAPGK